MCIKLGMQILKQFYILKAAKRRTDYPTCKENVTNWSCSYIILFRKKRETKKKTSEEQAKIVREVISVKYEELGPMSFHEGSVLILFIIVVLLWFFRKPEFIPGWAEVVASV